MPNLIDILINAQWRGGSATQRAQQQLRNIGDSASEADVRLSAVAQRSALLGGKMGELGKQVALGNLTVEEAQQQYNQFAGSLSTVGAQAQTQGQNFTSLATKIGTVTLALGGVALTARQAFQAIERGAGLDLTRQRFDRLAESIGTTGDRLRNDLLQATSGMLSEAQAMSLATDLLGLNLADTSDEAVRLARIVTELDADIGELTLALTNQTTRRFDQLGVSVDGFDERLERLSETMSDEQAFTMAFIEQAEAQIERVGGAADSTAGDVRRLQAAWQELRDTVALGLAEEASDSLAFLGDRNLVDNAEALGNAINNITIPLGKFLVLLSGIGLAAPGLIILTKIFGEGADEAEEYESAVLDLENAISDLGDSAEETDGPLRTLAHERFPELVVEMERVGETAELTADQIRKIGEAAVESAEAARSAAFEDLIERAALAPTIENVGRATAIVAGQAPPRIEGEGTDFTSTGDEAVDELEQRGRELADLWLDFQADINDINARAAEQRVETEERFEERRNDIIEDYGRRRARQEEELQRDIADVRENAAERRADLQEDANRRLQDLAEDHGRRMSEIQEDANRSIRDAAARLDVTGIRRIEEQRDDRLEDEAEAYERQREEIIETLHERLEEEREAEEERIQDLRARMKEIQRREAQDHQERLRRLDKEEQDRLRQIDRNARQRRLARQRQYIEERTELQNHWKDRDEIAGDWMERILEKEARWWRARFDMVGDGDFDFDGGGTGSGSGTGSGGDDTPPNPDQPWSRDVMETVAIDIANPHDTQSYLAWQQFFDTLSDAELARWIETNSDIDVPGYRHGGYVFDTGLAELHGTRARPEYVLTPETTERVSAILGQDITQRRIVEYVEAGRGAVEAARAPAVSDLEYHTIDPETAQIDDISAVARYSLVAPATPDVLDRAGTVRYSMTMDVEPDESLSLPGYLHGTPYVPKTGPAILHEGEAVLNRQQAERYRAGANVGEIVININEAQRPGDTAKEVRRELERLFEGVA